MKFTPEVVAALQVLRNNAESDFERHRLDVLERDLTEPPAVEVIDDKHQRFNGVTYLKDRQGHFTAGRGIHRTVWAYYNGEIPDGCEIHHLDGNKANNNVENFQCMTHNEHMKLHAKYRRIPQQEKTFICQYCGKEFVAKNLGHNLYCSAKCFEKARPPRNTTTKICAWCGQPFEAPTGKKNPCCSISCGKKLAWEKRRQTQSQTKICKFCGKEFSSAATNAVFCSKSCQNKHWKKNHGNPNPRKRHA